MSFKDHFSKQSATYTQFRPTYPPELFTFLAEQSPNREHALDTACGNGQAALALAAYFQKVTAADASENQINHAQPHPKVTYVIAPAEACGLPDHSVDLLTVAQAIHWFDFDRFYAEAKRVLKPGGLLAVMGYALFSIKPEVDAVIDKLYGPMLDEFWPPERKWIEEKYQTLPFPFEDIDHPQFHINASWTAQHVLGYLKSWSAVVRYTDHHGNNPVDAITPEFIEAWGDKETLEAKWPIIMRLGRV